MLFANDINNAKDTYLSGTKLVELNHVLFKKLVPVLAKDEPQTSAGKRLLGTNRMLYRFNNDGDIFPALRARGVWNYDDDATNTKIFYEILDDRLTDVINTRAGKAALVGTKFEYLIK